MSPRPRAIFVGLAVFVSSFHMGLTASAEIPFPAANDPDATFFRHHILAIDSNGSALCPVVKRKTKPDGTVDYGVSLPKMPGENTNRLEVARSGREPLYRYLTEMLADMERSRPDQVVVYIHGGLNNIKEATEKAAYMADYFSHGPASSAKIYYIGIAWNSDLLPTLHEHFFKVREGISQPGRAIVSAPATLLADFGGALARFPLRLIDLLYNDAHTIHPYAYRRDQAAQARYEALLKQGYSVSTGSDDQRRRTQAWNIVLFALNLPIKTALVPVVDGLGREPWKNMIRRTRTMFERESEFLPHVDPTAPDYSAIVSTARKGAMRIFCEKASDYLAALKQRDPRHTPPSVTLVGHSMGAIVAADVLRCSHAPGRKYDASYYHPLPLDNVVLMAAACSVNDFRNKIVPYLAAPNETKLKAPGSRPTHFYNLCLNSDAERSEQNPKLGFLPRLDIVPRGSLLVWIDTIYQEPESENDRTLGRWENAILATDDIPEGVLRVTTIKGFGRDRIRAGTRIPTYTVAGASENAHRTFQEPTHHGDFSAFAPAKGGGSEPFAADPGSFTFWQPGYREAEPDPAPRPFSRVTRW